MYETRRFESIVLATLAGAACAALVALNVAVYVMMARPAWADSFARWMMA